MISQPSRRSEGWLFYINTHAKELPKEHLINPYSDECIHYIESYKEGNICDMIHQTVTYEN
ncbi:MAG: hypothetical protein K0S47_3778 [Herbinix sp.]|jgi:hypothetical protein|nr:hypothetical protein [Herbinix sp.]